MIPIYEAVDFIKVMDGGSTFPWQVFVNIEGKANPYVVKLYKTNHLDSNQTILKEVICSRLASQFDIATPEPAFINFSQSFINTLPVEMRAVLNTVDARIKFGTSLIAPPYSNFSDALLKPTLKDYDLVSIYAFDNLILNSDRRTDKPNLLIGDDVFYVIDHELTLATIENVLNNFNNSNTWSYYYSNHILFSYLKGRASKAKKEGFDTFEYYLNYILNINQLDGLESQVSELGYETDCYLLIKDYLCQIKANSTKFLNLLKASIL